MTKQEKVFILRNEELGYTDKCPVFTNRHEADEAAAIKCREHTVIEVERTTLKACRPAKAYGCCLKCAIFVPRKR